MHLGRLTGRLPVSAGLVQGHAPFPGRLPERDREGGPERRRGRPGLRHLPGAAVPADLVRRHAVLWDPPPEADPRKGVPQLSPVPLRYKRRFPCAVVADE